MSARSFLGKRRELSPWRELAAFAELAYGAARALKDDGRPATAGGWPVRWSPLPRPRTYGRAERRAIARAMREQSSSFSDGTTVRRFETELARTLGARHAIAVSSGTSALDCAMIAAGIGPGDEVIVPVLGYAATALAVLHRGAVPRFVDADASTWNVDATAIEAAITPRTRAIVPVHLCGVPCDMDAILRVAEEHALVVIEDAAQAHGARWRGRRLGTIGALGCFSFQSAKALTTGEGGAVLTDDDELARRVRLAANLGERSEDGQPTYGVERFALETPLDYELAGSNHRMGALQAALGIAQLARVDDVARIGARNRERLRERLARVEGLRWQSAPPESAPCSTVAFFELVDDAVDRDELARALAAERIDCRKPYARPLAAHRLFGAESDWEHRYPVATRLTRNALGVRVDARLGKREIDATARALERIVAWAWRGSPSEQESTSASRR